MTESQFSKKEQKMSDESVDFIKNNKKLLIKTFADPSIYTTRQEPITIFMAGTPGAGKTEVANRLIEEKNTKPVHIDADQIRKLFQDIGYNGKNSYIFQKACSHGVDKLFDYVQQKHLHVVVDGTFASKNSIENVRRANGRKRKIFIYYIYQDPIVAWKAVKGRELEEGRNIPETAFIEAYKKSRENVNEAKKLFANVQLNLIVKNAESNMEKQRLNIDDVDAHIKNIYTNDELKNIIL